jgi:hypothetical protein
MRLALSSLALVAGLAGCATPAPVVPTVNFVPSSVGDQTKLAGDATAELTSLFPPAKTTFGWSLTPQASDAFGTALLADLRQKGYAVHEGAAGAAAAASAPAPASAEVPLRYTLDQIGDGGVYRVVLAAGQQTIVRAYALRDGAFAPIGAWSRKE